MSRFFLLAALVSLLCGLVSGTQIVNPGVSCAGTDETCVTLDMTSAFYPVISLFTFTINSAGEVCSFSSTSNILVGTGVGDGYPITGVTSGTFTIVGGVVTRINSLVLQTSGGVANLDGAVTLGSTTALTLKFLSVTTQNFQTSGDNCIMSVVGDPQFVGLRGQSYQVHGVDGAIYNIITDKNLQVNGEFTFLSAGDCPMINGQRDTNCWSHPGSYISKMSFQQVVDGKLHAALVSSGSAKQGFSDLQMDGKPIAVGQTVQFGSLSVTAVTSHKVVVSTEQFTFELTNSDMFINQALSTKVALSKLTTHGLLGQTHVSKVYPTSLRYIEGEVDDYTIADGNIFGDDFVYNQFQA